MAEKELLIGTRSKGKLPEIMAALSGVPFSLISLADVSDIPPDFEVEEPCMTFEGNAIAKAVTLGIKSGRITLTDDAGLEVDALGGRPGVLSARYAPGSDTDRNQKLLNEMHGVLDEKRTARFKTVIAIFDPHSLRLRTCSGVCEGVITHTPKGENGFGYDSIFYLPQMGKTGAELSLEEKNSVSHRGRALIIAKEILRTDFNSDDTI